MTGRRAPAGETVVPVCSRGWRVALDPTVGQERVLAQLVGTRRAVFNWGLGVRLSALADLRVAKAAGVPVALLPKAPGVTELMATWAAATRGELTLAMGPQGELRGVTWAAALPSRVPQQALRDLGAAWSNWHASRNGTRLNHRLHQLSSASQLHCTASQHGFAAQ